VEEAVAVTLHFAADADEDEEEVVITQDLRTCLHL
jgi:hypothetical protein